MPYLSSVYFVKMLVFLVEKWKKAQMLRRRTVEIREVFNGFLNGRHPSFQKMKNAAKHSPLEI